MNTVNVETNDNPQSDAAKFARACQTTALRDIQVTSEPGAGLTVKANIPNVDGIDAAVEINRRSDHDGDGRIVIFHGSQLHWGSMFTDEAPAYREDGTDRVKTFNAAFEAITKIFMAAEDVVDAAKQEAAADATALLAACATEISGPEKQ